MKCKCQRIKDSEKRNWNAACPVHGQGTAWFQGAGGDKLREMVSKQIDSKYQASLARTRRRQKANQT